MLQMQVKPQNTNKEAVQEHFDMQRQEALVEQLTATARFAEPHGHRCTGSSKSIEDCWSGVATIELESLPKFLSDDMDAIPIKKGPPRSPFIMANFVLSNINVDAVGGVQIVLVGKKVEKIEVLEVGQYMSVEARVGATIEARIKGKGVIK
jgi:hypothetical protein